MKAVGISPVPSNFWGQIPQDWQELFNRSEIEEIEKAVGNDYQPRLDKVFKAFETPIEEVKVVIVGQDPYPRVDHAMGLAFSVPQTINNLPPTLKNIFKELYSDIGITRTNGDLSDWSEQGVLLLNRTLTIGKNGLSNHRNLGWMNITENIIKNLGSAGKIGILWGGDAKNLEEYFLNDRVLNSVHPSPLSAYRGFFGSKPFSQTNEKLVNLGLSSIDW